MKKEDKKQCCEQVYDSAGWRNYQCRKNAVIEREGSSYCKIHDPEYIKMKNLKREKEYKRNSCKCSYHFNYAHYGYCPLCGEKRNKTT